MGAYNVYRPIAANGAAGPRGIMPPIHRAPNLTPPILRDTSQNRISGFVLQPTGLSVGGNPLFIVEEKSIVPQIAIESMNEKLEPIIARIETLTAEGKIKPENSAWVLGLIDQYRAQATRAMNENDAPGFVRNLASLEQIIDNIEALRDLYSNQLQLGVARATLDEAYKAGIFSQDAYEAAKERLSSKVAENARSRIENDETTFAITSMELMQMMETLSKIRGALEIYRSQSRSNDLRGMNHTAKRDILPKMGSINTIDQEHLKENDLLVDNAADVLQTMRGAQAELLENTRKHMETTGKYEDAIEAVGVIEEAATQAARTDANEATISGDMWQRIWAGKETEERQYSALKTKILTEMVLIANSMSRALNRAISDTPDTQEPITAKVPFEAAAKDIPSGAPNTRTANALWENEARLFIIALYKRMAEITEQWIKQDMAAQAAMLKQYEKKMEQKRTENRKAAQEKMLQEDTEQKTLFILALQRFFQAAIPITSDDMQQLNSDMLRSNAARLIRAAA